MTELEIVAELIRENRRTVAKTTAKEKVDFLSDSGINKLNELLPHKVRSHVHRDFMFVNSDGMSFQKKDLPDRYEVALVRYFLSHIKQGKLMQKRDVNAFKFDVCEFFQADIKNGAVVEAAHLQHFKIHVYNNGHVAKIYFNYVFKDLKRIMSLLSK